MRLAAAALALSIAVLAALLAHDVRSWRNTMQRRRDALRDLADRPGSIHSADLPSGRGLGPTACRQSRSAFALGAAVLRARSSTRPVPAYARAGQNLLHTTERSLTLAAQDPDGARAAQAYSLLAALLLKDARTGFSRDLAPYLIAITAMQNAVRVDPGNEHPASQSRAAPAAVPGRRKAKAPLPANDQGSKSAARLLDRGSSVLPLAKAGGDY